MQYELLGNSLPRVSELALETVAFGERWGWGRDECWRILEACREAGGNVIDTANEYVDGSAEHELRELLGDASTEVTLAARYTQRTSSCALGDGTTRIDDHRADRSGLLPTSQTPIPAAAR